MRSESDFPAPQDDDETGFNTSDEEFERQLEEAALLEEQAKAEKAATPAPIAKKRLKRGRGRNAKKKTKTTNKNDPDAEGYEVCTGLTHTLLA